MSRLGELLGGIGKEDYYLLTAGSGVGKSTLMYDFVNNFPKEFLDTYDNIDIKLTVFVNMLEESVKTLTMRAIIGKLSAKGIDLNLRDLQGRRLTPIDDYVISEIIEASESLELERKHYSDKYNVYYSDIGNPFGFYKSVRNYLAKSGKYFDANNNEVSFSKILKGEVPDYSYKPNNPKELIIVVSDHLKLYSAESGKKWYDTLEYFSQIYCRRILNLKYGCAVINVQQQASASESIIFDKNGKPIIENTYPTTHNLGDITTTQRDATIILGVWNPHKYGVEKDTVAGLSIDYAAFKRKGMPIRVIKPLKNRDGNEGGTLVCWVDFKTRKFYQLPKTQEGIDALLSN